MKKQSKFILLLLFVFVVSIGYAQEAVKVEKPDGEKAEQTVKAPQKHVEVILTKEISNDGKVITKKTVRETKIPEDFPKYVDTGDPKNDRVRFYEEKQKWIKENPERFEKIKHLNLNAR